MDDIQSYPKHLNMQGGQGISEQSFLLDLDNLWRALGSEIIDTQNFRGAKTPLTPILSRRWLYMDKKSGLLKYVLAIFKIDIMPW